MNFLLLSVLAAASASTTELPLIVERTPLVRGPAEDPSAELSIELVRALEPPARIRLLDRAGEVVAAFAPPVNEAGRSFRVPAPMPRFGGRVQLAVEVEEAGATSRGEVVYRAPDDGWTLHFVPGFHYDPVWWNTQAHYTETGRYLDAHVGPGLELVGEYLDVCRTDPDYRVAFHQLPYLKTFLEARPERAAELLALFERDPSAAVGGTYNELSSTLVSAEATARNAIYGTLFQRDVLGGAGTTFWQCDVFGHDPSFPALMAASGHTGGAFARGPFHQWGAPREQVNFPSEFLWMAPDGTSVLTHYMTGHYGYAYARFATGANRASDDPAVTNALIAEMFEDLKRPALTHHVLLPMHVDFVRPLANLGDVLREWNRAYVSPRAVMDTSEGFFRAVRAEVEERRIEVPVITRDMNPVYTGCAVSFADLKLANRACERTLREAELFATLAALEGAEFPWAAVDRAWRQLLFNAHHDGVTGSMSDQVYLDVMAGYRDALELATEVRERALARLTRATGAAAGETVAWNPVAHPRSGTVVVGGRRVPTGDQAKVISPDQLRAFFRSNEATLHRLSKTAQKRVERYTMTAHQRRKAVAA